MKAWFDKCTCIITGASSGIGRGLTKKLILDNDCKVIGIGRNEQKMLSLIEELGNKKDNFEYYLFDVSSEFNWKGFASTIQDREINILINNAGVLPPFANYEKLLNNDTHRNQNHFINKCDNITEVMNINFMSMIYSCTYLLPIIEKSKTPAVINVSSSAGLCALPGISSYSASKAAVKNFTECLALEKGYYVGLICPGFTKTEIFRNQKYTTENKLINMISTDLDKMVGKIYKCIKAKKKRCVIGFDAKCMDWGYRHFPNASLKLFRAVLKKAKIELFNEVFENNKKKGK